METYDVIITGTVSCLIAADSPEEAKEIALNDLGVRFETIDHVEVEEY